VFVGDPWRLQEEVPTRDASTVQVPIGIELQVYDPQLTSKEIGGHRLTTDKVFSGRTAIRDVRQSASLQEALAQPSVCDWLGDGLAAKPLTAEQGDGRLAVCS
jgi:hypothetical protein